MMVCDGVRYGVIMIKRDGVEAAVRRGSIRLTIVENISENCKSSREAKCSDKFYYILLSNNKKNIKPPYSRKKDQYVHATTKHLHQEQH